MCISVIEDMLFEMLKEKGRKREYQRKRITDKIEKFENPWEEDSMLLRNIGAQVTLLNEIISKVAVILIEEEAKKEIN